MRLMKRILMVSATLRLASTVLALGVGAGAHAQNGPWPTKPVSLVVGTPPGGATDIYARSLAQQLGKITGGTFLVDNRAGANGNISAEYVQRAPADGSTLWIGTQAMMAINPSAYPSLRWKPAAFKPIVKGVEAPLVLVTNTSVPAKNFADLIKWAKDKSHHAAYASYSPGTPSHFLGFQLNEKFGLDLVHVPYKGSAPQINDILSGQVPMGFTQLQTALPHIEAGKLNAIVVTGNQRWRALPNVPTFAELGHPDLSTAIWFGLLASTSTPPAIMAAIESAAIKAQSDPDFRSRMEAQGFDVPKESGAAFARTITVETARWAQVVKATGFKAND
jgi:tripartite-type tricarboxylate transporter receptor subunit TctC